MNKSAIFKAAHALTKATVQAGDSYAVTFAAALRIVIAESKAPKTLADRLIEAGAKVWTSPNGKITRVYVNQAAANAVFNDDILKGWPVRVNISKTANLYVDENGNLFSNSGSNRTAFNATTHDTGLSCGKA